MDYSTRRNLLSQRLQQQIAEPVAELLATAYEPRFETEPYDDKFNRLVVHMQKQLQTAIKDLTSRDGGQIEVIAKQAAKELAEEAKNTDLTMAAAQLIAALERCDQVITANQTPAMLQNKKLPDLERVIGQSGKPIGLWR